MVRLWLKVDLDDLLCVRMILRASDKVSDPSRVVWESIPYAGVQPPLFIQQSGGRRTRERAIVSSIALVVVGPSGPIVVVLLLYGQVPIARSAKQGMCRRLRQGTTHPYSTAYTTVGHDGRGVSHYASCQRTCGVGRGGPFLRSGASSSPGQ